MRSSIEQVGTGLKSWSPDVTSGGGSCIGGGDLYRGRGVSQDPIQ